ncbi:MAG: hypothetical protein F6K65_41555 [Moorea sp. SIO3C2]|nr:hypothetical protein [Moorena sp. SIO3C2]
MERNSRIKPLLGHCREFNFWDIEPGAMFGAVEDFKFFSAMLLGLGQKATLREGRRYAPEAFRQSRRYANAKRGQPPQLPRLCD